MIAIALWILGLTGVFALTIASGDPRDLITGLVVSTVTVVLLRKLIWPHGAASRTLTARQLLRSLVAAPGFLLMTMRDMTVGTWAVGLVVLGIRPLRKPGVVVIPVDDRTEMGAVVTALATTVSPGELALDHDTERRELVMHVLDASDPEAVIKRHKWLYERWQKRFVP